VGNSSAGVREAPVYGVPTINIGTRQSNRYSYPSIVDVSNDEAAIFAAMQHLPGLNIPSSDFGDGKSAERFANALTSRGFWETPRQKQFQDHLLSAPSL
jgi:UDP-N-acetylglucosamine 2-epimerase (hydrolysing)